MNERLGVIEHQAQREYLEDRWIKGPVNYNRVTPDCDKMNAILIAQSSRLGTNGKVRAIHTIQDLSLLSHDGLTNIMSVQIIAIIML
jgi:hypothetical protein